MNQQGWSVEQFDALLPPLLETTSADNGAMTLIGGTLPSNLPTYLVRMAGEAPGADRSKQTYAFIRGLIEWGCRDEEIFALAATHKPSVAKYGRRLAAQVGKIVSEHRPNHVHVGSPCDLAGCPHVPSWMGKPPRSPASPPGTGRSNTEASDHRSRDSRASSGNQPQADRLLDLAADAYTFHRDPTGEPFVMPVNGARVARLLRGRNGLRAELANRFATAYNTAPSDNALRSALLVIDGRCSNSPVTKTFLRVARDGDGVVVDLGRDDGAVVVVDRDGWSVVRTSPVVFRRTGLTLELPIPDSSGDLERFRLLLNVDDSGWALLRCWLVAGLLPGRPTPILALLAEQGSAKTTFARLVASLVDPSAAPTRAEPRDMNDWAVTASASHIVALDNMSRIQPWLSDALCRAVTGEGVIRRALYTDSDLSVISFHGRLIVTSISTNGFRGDLADRLLPVELERITPERRREESEILAAFKAMHAAALGGLLTLVSQVLSVIEDIRLADLPRMADFGRVVAAVDKITGSDALADYLRRTAGAVADSLDSDLAGAAVRDFVLDHGVWEGTAADLLQAIETPDRKPRDWPSTPRAMSNTLTRNAPALRATGIDVFPSERRGHGGRRTWQLRVKDVPSEPSPPSSLSPHAADQHEQTPMAGVGPVADGDGARADQMALSPTDTTTDTNITAGQDTYRAMGDGGDGPAATPS